MDNSNFIRIIVSNRDVIINGIYLLLDFKSEYYYDKTYKNNEDSSDYNSRSYDKSFCHDNVKEGNNHFSTNKNKYKKILFVITNQENKKIIDDLKRIERNILLKINNVNKIKNYKLSNHLDEES